MKGSRRRKFYTHQLKLPLFKTDADGRGLLKPVMEVVVFNPHANTSNMHVARWQKEKIERKIETKIVTVLMFSHSGNLTLGSNAGVGITPLSPRCISLVLSIRRTSLTGYATFLIFGFLSIEFIAELPYKSLRLSGCFHTVLCLTIIIDDRLRRRWQ